jgi:hypothetical protein
MRLFVGISKITPASTLFHVGPYFNNVYSDKHYQNHACFHFASCEPFSHNVHNLKREPSFGNAHKTMSKFTPMSRKH